MPLAAHRSKYPSEQREEFGSQSRAVRAVIARFSPYRNCHLPQPSTKTQMMPSNREALGVGQDPQVHRQTQLRNPHNSRYFSLYIDHIPHRRTLLQSLHYSLEIGTVFGGHCATRSVCTARCKCSLFTDFSAHAIDTTKVASKYVTHTVHFDAPFQMLSEKFTRFFANRLPRIWSKQAIHGLKIGVHGSNIAALWIRPPGGAGSRNVQSVFD